MISGKRQRKQIMNNRKLSQIITIVICLIFAVLGVILNSSYLT